MTSQVTIRTTAGRGRLFESILDTIGDTPAVRINNLAPTHASIYVKAEFFNPAASVKDRLALNSVEEGERYMTRPLFEGIDEGMTEEELALSRSTPSAQFAA